MVKNQNVTGYDVMNIAGDAIPALPKEMEKLLKEGKKKRVQLLEGTESPQSKLREKYAITTVKISFGNERDLKTCVRLLRWSDDRLRARPEQMILWDWSRTFREGMDIFFGVSWYEKEFFEKRKNAFLESGHVSYYSLFNKTPKDFKIKHKIL